MNAIVKHKRGENSATVSAQVPADIADDVMLRFQGVLDELAQPGLVPLSKLQQVHLKILPWATEEGFYQLGYIQQLIILSDKELAVQYMESESGGISSSAEEIKVVGTDIIPLWATVEVDRVPDILKAVSNAR